MVEIIILCSVTFHNYIAELFSYVKKSGQMFRKSHSKVCGGQMERPTLCLTRIVRKRGGSLKTTKSSAEAQT